MKKTNIEKIERVVDKGIGEFGRPITELQRRWLLNYMATGNATDAARKAGYNAKTRNMLGVIGAHNKKKLKPIIDAWLESEKLDDTSLKEKLVEGLEAKEKKFFAHKGKVKDVREVIPWEIRHRYLRTAMEFRGMLSQETGTRVNVAVNFGFERRRKSVEVESG